MTNPYPIHTVYPRRSATRPSRVYAMSLPDLETLAETMTLIDNHIDMVEAHDLVDRCRAIIRAAAGPDAHLIFPEAA